MSVFDPTKPTGSDPKSQGDDQIRDFKSHVVDMLEAPGLDLGAAGESVLDRTTDSSHPRHRYRGLIGNTADLPTPGLFGLFFDQQRNALRRDNGASWADIATLVPAGTKAPFFQAAAPVGWTKDVTHHGKAIRVVTDGSGGTAGAGTVDPDSVVTLAHSHTVNSHTHTMKDHTHATPAHVHRIDYTAVSHASSSGTVLGGAGSQPATDNTDGAELGIEGSGAGASHTFRHLKNQTIGGDGTGTTGGPSDNTSGATAPGTDSQLTDLHLAVVNMIICTKS